MTTFTFERDRLRLARELKGWSQTKVAEDADISPAALSQFESGSTRPKPETLARLAEVLDVPASFFDQPLVESHEGFFRSLRRTPVLERRRARAIAHLAHDALAHPAAVGVLPAQTVPYIAAPPDADAAEIELIAEQVRAEWNLPPGPIPDVVHVLEEHGIAVVRLPLATADVDAFSLPFPDHSVVVLGSDKNDRARSRFDAAHELGHLVMHGDQIWGTKLVELQAHQFAAGFLLPRDQIIGQLPETVDWDTLFRLKQQWQVSLAALLMRARTLERMSPNTYLTAIKTAAVRGWRRTEPVPLGPPESPDRLNAFLGSPKSQQLHDVLPTHVISAVASATAAA